MDLAIDGGTTNTRAVLLDNDRPIAIARRAIGIRDREGTNWPVPLEDAIAQAIEEVFLASGMEGNVGWARIDQVVASGMVTSASGIVELNHVAGPCSIEDLARGVVERPFPRIGPAPIRFVPGARIGNEMMRGEECEAFGLLHLTGRRGPIRILLPGSHTKLVTVDGAGTIVAIRTSLAGELLAALAEQTILKASVSSPLPAKPDPKSVAHGAGFARDRGLLCALFQIRAADILHGLDPARCASLLVGMVVGSDIDQMVQAGAIDPIMPTLIGGSEPLRSVYADLARDAIAAMGGGRGLVEPASEADALAASAVGAVQIARRASPIC